MSSFFGAVVGLLTAAFSLLGFAQAHPELPQAQRDQATQFATQAIQQATQVLQSAVPTPDSTGFVASPTSGLAPLTVYFNNFQRPSEWPQNVGSSYQLKLDYGDGGHGFEIPGNCHACNDSHVYQSAGTYIAKLTKFSNYPNDEASIGSITITVTGPQVITVPGMSKYTDPDFGFSFWYPSGWKLEQPGVNNADTAYPGGLVKKRFILWSTIDNDHTVTIEEFYSPTASIRLNADSGCPGGICSPTLNYFFDAGLHTWMMAYPNGFSSERGDGGIAIGTTLAADVSHNTMGGLHIFGGGFRGEHMLIPLSAHNFVIVSDQPWNVGPDFKSYLVNTIVALDPAVATPVSAANQANVIQSEKDSYLVIKSHAPAEQ